MQSGRIVSTMEIIGGADWANPGITAQNGYMGNMEKMFRAAEKTPTEDTYAILEGIEFALKSLRNRMSIKEMALPEVANLMLEIENLIESARVAYELGYYDSTEAVALAALEAYRALEEVIKGKRSK
ncbi:hypothetical protein [Palaeococcus ferrophilus]|uniref:hypothetical protein n=1 Tax=Palaeococcus ferrophilus TaxID=83868 RepID=UPI00064F36C0|nr:hypothetical protein [Palaeococcus ferrophilus]